MDNFEVIRKAKTYLIKYKTVDLIWFVKDHLGLEKNAREIDIINQGILELPWFTNYKGHNQNDVSIKYSYYTRLSTIVSSTGGIIGLIGGILGIIAFFK